MNDLPPYINLNTISNVNLKSLFEPILKKFHEQKELPTRPILNLDYLEAHKTNFITQLKILFNYKLRDNENADFQLELLFSKILEQAYIQLFDKNNLLIQDNSNLNTAKDELLPYSYYKLGDEVKFHKRGNYSHIQLIALKKLLKQYPNHEFTNILDNRICDFELGHKSKNGLTRFEELKIKLKGQIPSIDNDDSLSESNKAIAINDLFKQSIILREELVVSDPLFQEYLSTEIYNLITELINIVLAQKSDLVDQLYKIFGK